MIDTSYDVLIIGAGYAGLCLSYFLKLKGINHLVIEKGTIGSTWKQQRWYSMKLNTPNKLNVLPGYEDYFTKPDAFAYAIEYVDYLKAYCDKFELPVMEQCEITKITKNAEKRFFVCGHSGDREIRYYSKKVVVASGAQNQPIMPSIIDGFDKKLHRIHVAAYKNADDLPEGGILIIGSGQSGAQVADDLLDRGRNVYLSTSKVGHIPRRYRGKDIEDWLVLTGFYETATEKMTPAELQGMKQPLISGNGIKGKTLTLLSLEKRGAVLLGKTKSATGKIMQFETNTNKNIRFGLDFSERIKATIDTFIEENKMLDAISMGDEDIEEQYEVPEIETLDLRVHNINTVIFATGYSYNFNYLKFPIFTKDHRLIEHPGPKSVKGLYFLNLPNQFKLKSGIILGIAEDAQNLVDQLAFDL